MNHWMTITEISTLKDQDVEFLAKHIICVCGPQGECTYCKAKAEHIKRLKENGHG